MPTTRSDHTEYVIHWCKGSTYAEAFLSLAKIAVDEFIYGSNTNITANCNCVCFSEAPAASFHERKGIFQPFGIKLAKKWLFSKGGRPVIYQPKEDFKLLPQELNWKHVNFSLSDNYRNDFHWQREWRIKTDKLGLPVNEVTLIIPNETYSFCLEKYFSDENFARGLASCDPYGYGSYYSHHPTVANQFRIEVISVVQD